MGGTAGTAGTVLPPGYIDGAVGAVTVGVGVTEGTTAGVIGVWGFTEPPPPLLFAAGGRVSMLLLSGGGRLSVLLLEAGAEAGTTGTEGSGLLPFGPASARRSHQCHSQQGCIGTVSRTVM